MTENIKCVDAFIFVLLHIYMIFKLFHWKVDSILSKPIEISFIYGFFIIIDKLKKIKGMSTYTYCITFRYVFCCPVYDIKYSPYE